MNKITKHLNQHITGHVFDREAILRAYSQDKSVMTVIPRLVAIPTSVSDVQYLLRFSDDIAKKGFKLPITVRGAGNSKTGSCLGEGMIISTEKMNKIEEIDEHSRFVRVQAGVTLEKLNAVLAAYNLCIPIKANPKETIGGLISSFPTDPMAKKYGSIYYFVDRLEVVLNTGEIVQTVSYTQNGMKNLAQKDNVINSIYENIEKIVDENIQTIKNINREKSGHAGYSMISQVKNAETKNFDLMPLFFGAEGTLGVITEVILRTEPIPRPSKHILATFRTIAEATDYMNRVLKLQPAILDIYDSRIFQVAANHGKTLGLLEPILEHGYYVLVAFNDSWFQINNRIKMCLGIGTRANSITAENNLNTDDFKKISTLVECYLNDENSTERPSLVDDFSIKPENIVKFIEKVGMIERALKQDLPIFGSFATNVYTVRPDFNLSTLNGRKNSMQFLRFFGKLVKECGGTFAGGSSEGRVKGLVSTPELPPEEREIYCQIKQIFDPRGILNPGTKLEASFKDVVRHLRTTEAEGVNRD